MEAHNFRLDRGETGTKKGKYSNHIAYQIRKPANPQTISIFENVKPNAKKNQQTTKYTEPKDQRFPE